MKTLIKRLQCFVFALVFIFTFVFNCYLDSKSNNVYAVETVMYYAYEVVLTLLAELGICVTDVDYAYTGEKVARDKKQLVNKVKSSFDTFMKSTKANYIFLHEGYETLWEHRLDIADEFGTLLSSASCKTFTLSRELSQALVIWAREIRSKMGDKDNFETVAKYMSAEDYDVVMNGGKLNADIIREILSIPSYMVDDKWLSCGFNDIVNSSYDISIYRSINLDSCFVGFYFFEHYMKVNSKRVPCEIILNNTDKFTDAGLVTHCVYNGIDKYGYAYARRVVLNLKGYFADPEQFSWKYYSSTDCYVSPTDIPDLLWNSKTGIRDNEGYVSAKAIPDSALADVYVTPELVDVISKPHDLSKLKDLTIAQILEMLREGTITYEQAMELIKAITDSDTVVDAEVKDEVKPSEPSEDNTEESEDMGENKPIKDVNMQFDLKKLFPFCIPFDVLAFVTVLNATPEAPCFTIPIKIGSFVNYTITVDFSKFVTLSKILRIGIGIIYICALAVVTSKLIKW